MNETGDSEKTGKDVNRVVSVTNRTIEITIAVA
jgi:hypothetical protein